MKLQLRVQPILVRPGAAGMALSPQQVAPTRDLTSVRLKAWVKGFQEQKTYWSCGYYLWGNEASKKNCQNFVKILTSRCTVEVILRKSKSVLLAFFFMKMSFTAKNKQVKTFGGFLLRFSSFLYNLDSNFVLI